MRIQITQHARNCLQEIYIYYKDLGQGKLGQK